MNTAQEQAAIKAFFDKGGQATMCPTRIVAPSPQLARHLKPLTGFLAQRATSSENRVGN